MENGKRKGHPEIKSDVSTKVAITKFTSLISNSNFNKNNNWAAVIN